MSHKSLGFALAGLLLAAPAALDAAKSKVEYDKKTDFSTVKTYAWGKKQALDTADKKEDADAALDEMLVKEVDEALAAKGWTKQPGKADVVIDRDVRVLTEEKSSSASSGIGNGMGIDGTSDISRSVMIQVNTQTLTLIVRGGEDEKELWRAAIGENTKEKGTQKIHDELQKELRKTLAKFPPGSKK
jgi:hypothetical protein